MSTIAKKSLVVVSGVPDVLKMPGVAINTCVNKTTNKKELINTMVI